MSMQKSFTQSSGQGIQTLFLVVLSLFIGLFFTKDFMSQSYELTEGIETAHTEKTLLGQQFEKLEGLKKQGIDMVSEEKLIGTFQEDRILEDIFDLVGVRGKIGDIMLTPGQKTNQGLQVATITLSLTTESLTAYLAILDDAVGRIGKQRYMIRTSTIPYKSGEDFGISTTLQLAMYVLGK